MNHLLESSLNDPATLKAFIKYEVLQKKPVFESYRTFCKAMGPETMNYPDFEFWFMRFYNGQLDVNYDRSQDPEPKHFQDLPMDIVEKVIKKLDPIDRIITCHVSTSLRNCIDRQKISIDNIQIIVSDDAWTLNGVPHEKESLKYEKTSAGCSISVENRKVDIKGGNFIRYALQDINGFNIAKVKALHVYGGLRHIQTKVLKHISHSEQFNVDVDQPSIKGLTVFKEMIFHSPIFKKCVLQTANTIKSCIVDAAFGEKISEEGREKIFLPIPGSMVQLKVTHLRYQLIIEKFHGV